jgi:hypothetical protein
MATKVARRTKRRIGGRTYVALSLISLLGIAAIVVWRRSLAMGEAKVVRDLTNEKRTLLSQKTSLQRDLREAMKRARIVSAAEQRLGMHVATELEVRNLPAPGAAKDSVP